MSWWTWFLIFLFLFKSLFLRFTLSFLCVCVSSRQWILVFFTATTSGQKYISTESEDWKWTLYLFVIGLCLTQKHQSIKYRPKQTNKTKKTCKLRDRPVRWNQNKGNPLKANQTLDHQTWTDNWQINLGNRTSKLNIKPQGQIRLLLSPHLTRTRRNWGHSTEAQQRGHIPSLSCSVKINQTKISAQHMISHSPFAHGICWEHSCFTDDEPFWFYWPRDGCSSSASLWTKL